ncbi:MAG: hypothetical protein IJ838_03270 [Paludibacteraceae bacterium]|nr:hypothetical protein [Paludibacteraceae bacterium]
MNNNSKFQSVVQGKARWLFALFALLTLGVVEMWAAEGVPKQISKDTAYIITPAISTKDTIYLKHEDIKPTETWWNKNSGNLIQAILVLILGAGISWLTTTIDGRKERMMKKQEKIADKAIEIEENIYSLLIDIRNTPSPKEREQLLNEFAAHLQKAELIMPTLLINAANDIYNYYLDLANDQEQIQRTDTENNLFENYKYLYNQKV